ncbi:sensor histidine kinase [Nocardioides sp.]|uniref:sensor histidine kinase n=1 Tax=Nocardioides sp. TaxID=35761 RepID=UPI003D0B4FF9
MRRRISWLVIATTSTVVVSFVIPLCLLVRILAEDRAMAAATQEAQNIAILVADLDDSPQLEALVDATGRSSDPVTHVLTVEGQWIGPGAAPAIDAEVRRARDDNEAFSVHDGAGGRVYQPVVTEAGTAVVRSTVTPAELHRGVTAAWLSIVGLGLLLMLMALQIALWLGRRVSEPLREVAGVAHQLREGDLAARAEVRGTEETQELARALNGLAERTGELLVAERASVADLSHRLRTPVTALRLDAEAVAEPELAVRLQEHIASLQRTIDAIVKEARRPVRTALPPVCDATATVADRLAFWSALADDQGRRLSTDLPHEALLVAVAQDDLADLVDVLIDNVFAHTPEGSAFRVNLYAEAGVAHLLVDDDGPGLSGDRTERTGSTGLGLDIARRTAVAAGGDLRVSNPGSGGARVQVVLPLLPSQAD